MEFELIMKVCSEHPIFMYVLKDMIDYYFDAYSRDQNSLDAFLYDGTDRYRNRLIGMILAYDENGFIKSEEATCINRALCAQSDWDQFDATDDTHEFLEWHKLCEQLQEFLEKQRTIAGN